MVCWLLVSLTYFKTMTLARSLSMPTNPFNMIRPQYQRLILYNIQGVFVISYLEYSLKTLERYTRFFIFLFGKSIVTNIQCKNSSVGVLRVIPFLAWLSTLLKFSHLGRKMLVLQLRFTWFWVLNQTYCLLYVLNYLNSLYSTNVQYK